MDIDLVAEEDRARPIGVFGKASNHAAESSTSDGSDSVCVASSSCTSNETRSIVRALRTYPG